MIVLVDVNLSPRVVAALGRMGLRAIRVGEVLQVRATDEEILAEAERLGAILVSQDQDFSGMLATRGATLPSLVNVRTVEVDPDVLAGRIAGVLRAFGEDLAAGAIVTIDDAGVRLHRLPVT